MSQSKLLFLKYSNGFVLSLSLTVIAYMVATTKSFTMDALLLTLGGLALLQLGVQLLFFLHLDDETRPRLKLLSFGFMAGVLSIIIAGSLWIMYNLNYNMMEMTPNEKDIYMASQKDKGF